MKRKNMTRNALVTSILSLLLCVSMLVGTTFAWFTDEVVTGMNTIAAGNLDVELYAGDTKVDNGTTLFDEVELWEPGVVCYETLQVKNVGTLALKYQLALNFGDENATTEGYKLSEVLKVAVVDAIADDATRAQVMEAAKDANPSTLADFRMNGQLLPGTDAAPKTFVIFWEPNDDEIDNRYNVNNGKTTTDGDDLHIAFGINLQATQLMYEDDCFGTDYDSGAVFLPNATVNMLPADDITFTTNDWGNGVATNTVKAPFIMQFLPNETAEQAEESEVKYWHAEYVVSADKEVPANSMALVGYYKAFCDPVNNGNWVALTSDEAIPANTEIRLIDILPGDISVNYREICEFGNDGTGFLCTAIDMNGSNAGTTITVELRLYQTEEPSEANGNSHNVETGYYQVVDTQTYTFPG